MSPLNWLDAHPELVDAASLLGLGAGLLVLVAFAVRDFVRAWNEGNGGEP